MTTAAAVRQRCVFYISGFDPKGAARYHALYRHEAARQAALGHIALQVGSRRRLASGDSCWEIEAQEDGLPVRTHYEFLQWDSIVRAHWTTRRLRLAIDLVGASLYLLRSGALPALWRAHHTASIVLMLPFLLLCAVVLLVPLAALAAGVAAFELADSPHAAAFAGAAAAALLGGLLLRARKTWSADWLARSLAFHVRQARGEVPGLEELLDRHAARIAQRLAEALDDEVLVVGHSSGSILAVSIVARVLARLPQRPPVFSLLTLGQCIPVVGALPPAAQFRRELLALGSSERVNWIDFSAPPDGCCFPLVDPLAACQVPRQAATAGPRLLSPRFHQMFDAAEYAERRRDKFTLHFQYLQAGTRNVPYDFFSITAGARTLAARYAGPDGAAS